MNFKINSSSLFTIIFKLKNDDFKPRDFSPLIERVLAGVNCAEYGNQVVLMKTNKLCDFLGGVLPLRKSSHAVIQ